MLHVRVVCPALVTRSLTGRLAVAPCAPRARSGDHLRRVIRGGSAGSDDGLVTERYDVIIVGSGAGDGTLSRMP